MLSIRYFYWWRVSLEWIKWWWTDFGVDDTNTSIDIIAGQTHLDVVSLFFWTMFVGYFLATLKKIGRLFFLILFIVRIVAKWTCSIFLGLTMTLDQWERSPTGESPLLVRNKDGLLEALPEAAAMQFTGHWLLCQLAEWVLYPSRIQYNISCIDGHIRWENHVPTPMFGVP